MHAQTNMMKDIVEIAQSLVGEFSLSEPWLTAGSVAAALLSEQNNVYTGICLDLACGIGFCAEHAAIADMLKHRETRVLDIVAVSRKGILAPCGRCRELMLQINHENVHTRIRMPGMKHVLLHELLPQHWLEMNRTSPTGITKRV